VIIHVVWAGGTARTWRLNIVWSGEGGLGLGWALGWGLGLGYGAKDIKKAGGKESLAHWCIITIVLSCDSLVIVLSFCFERMLYLGWKSISFSGKKKKEEVT
jgi:hypothetical protein